MAYDPWPAQFGEWLLAGHQLELPPAILETAMDKGPPKRRALTDALPSPVNAQIELTRAQWIAFATWYQVTLVNGTLPFTKRDPIYGVDRDYQFRADQGPRAAPTGDPDALLVTLPLQMLPSG